MNAIHIDEEILQCSMQIKYIGAWMDQNMNFQTHFTKRCQSAMLNLLKIRSIRQFLTKKSCETLVVSTVLSQLDYANSLLIGSP